MNFRPELEGTKLGWVHRNRGSRWSRKERRRRRGKKRRERSSDVQKTKATSDSSRFGPRIDSWDSPQSEMLMGVLVWPRGVATWGSCNRRINLKFSTIPKIAGYNLAVSINYEQDIVQETAINPSPDTNSTGWE